MDEFMWDWVLSHQELVFARSSPEQKLRIVKEFQRRGEIVAVTGDSTKDVPVLKCANLGIATQSGSEASKESSDVILLENNFAWIVQAIETGRLLGDNLKKVAIYLLPGGKWLVTASNSKLSLASLGSWSQIWPLFFSLWFGMPLALSAICCTIFCMLNGMLSVECILLFTSIIQMYSCHLPWPQRSLNVISCRDHPPIVRKIICSI